jgi:hypothetical protein
LPDSTGPIQDDKHSVHTPFLSSVFLGGSTL